jgi:hypothetical protein
MTFQNNCDHVPQFTSFIPIQIPSRYLGIPLADIAQSRRCDPKKIRREIQYANIRVMNLSIGQGENE